MEQNYKLMDPIERITLMESYLDEIKIWLCRFEHENTNTAKQMIFENDLRKKFNLLMDYYFNGLWLKDYEADERGEFPADLKRGVLAEDTLYNLYSTMQSFV